MWHFFTVRKAAVAAVVVAGSGLLAGCEPLSITALGIGGSAAVNHRAGATSARTFTAPIAKVRTASVGALNRMGMKTGGMRMIENGELIRAQAGKREIEVELESLTPYTTQMRVVARDGSLFYDSATASEIIVQTGKALGV
jgi:hypothetical protein